MKPLPLALLLFVALCTACSRPPAGPAPLVTEDAVQAIIAKRHHRLTFERYGDEKVALMPEQAREARIRTWDPETAIYVLDGQRIGTGSQGWQALKYVISRMRKGDSLDLGPYYGGGGYPFSDNELSNFCRKHGVGLGVPAL